jgi:hypothetical protein
MEIWSILRPFDILCGHLVYFVVFWYVFSPCWHIVPRKLWQPCNECMLATVIFCQADESLKTGFDPTASKFSGSNLAPNCRYFLSVFLKTI